MKMTMLWIWTRGRMKIQRTMLMKKLIKRKVKKKMRVMRTKKRKRVAKRMKMRLSRAGADPDLGRGGGAIRPSLLKM